MASNDGSPAAMMRFATGSSGPFHSRSSHFLPSRMAACSAAVNSIPSAQASVVAMNLFLKARAPAGSEICCARAKSRGSAKRIAARDHSMVEPELPIERFEIFANGLDHPECLAFDREGWLWAGGEAGQVYRISPAGGLETVAELGGFCGGVARTPDDADLFVCNPHHGIVRVNRDSAWSVFAAEAGGRRLICPNYGLFDRSGNYYVTDS